MKTEAKKEDESEEEETEFVDGKKVYYPMNGDPPFIVVDSTFNNLFPITGYKDTPVKCCKYCEWNPCFMTLHYSMFALLGTGTG